MMWTLIHSCCTLYNVKRFPSAPPKQAVGSQRPYSFSRGLVRIYLHSTLKALTTLVAKLMLKQNTCKCIKLCSEDLQASSDYECIRFLVVFCLFFFFCVSVFLMLQLPYQKRIMQSLFLNKFIISILSIVCREFKHIQPQSTIFLAYTFINSML